MTAPAWLTAPSTRWFRHPVGVECLHQNEMLFRRRPSMGSGFYEVHLSAKNDGSEYWLEDAPFREAWERLCSRIEHEQRHEDYQTPNDGFGKPPPGRYWLCGPRVVRCLERAVPFCPHCQDGYLNPDNRTEHRLIPEDDESLRKNIIVSPTDFPLIERILDGFCKDQGIPGIRAISAAGERWDWKR